MFHTCDNPVANLLFIMRIYDIILRDDEYRFSLLGKSKENKWISLDHIPGIQCDWKIREDDAVISVYVPTELSADLKECKLRLGIDCYMENYATWGKKFFPTYFCAEKTHFYGVMVSPENVFLAIASESPVKGVEYLYSTVMYDDGLNVGHRIYTVDILLNKNNSKGDIVFVLNLKICEKNDVAKFWEEICCAPLIIPDKFTYERGEIPQWNIADTLTIIHEKGRSYQIGQPLTEYGIYNIAYSSGNKIISAKIYVRHPILDYIKKASEFSYKYQQKPSSNCESWYGWFSVFLGLQHFPDQVKLLKRQAEFDEFLSVMLRDDYTDLTPAAAPQRIQNTAVMISLLIAACKTCKNDRYLNIARSLAKKLLTYQTADGALRMRNVHYSCVIYPFKSLMELYVILTEKHLDIQETQNIKIAIRRGIEDLLRRKDNVGTEGEMTFEDGMITCAALQLAMYALVFKDDLQQSCIEVAEMLMRKHLCLENYISNDCRNRGATLRFWETMYDVLIRKNAMTSPHGWTAWKIYAIYYLYRLTGKVEYLIDMFDTLGACLQLVDFDKDCLYWSFVTDDILYADVFVPTADRRGKLENRQIGKTYLPMISDWWRADPGVVVKGYAYIVDGICDGLYKGASCDNDVHEIFKCAGETICGRAFFHDTNHGPICYQCQIAENQILVDQDIEELILYAKNENHFYINGKIYQPKIGFNQVKVC